MSLIIGGAACAGFADLSETAQACLSLVDGGRFWFEWATASPAARYAFDDETALAQGVQEGLHGTGAMLLPTLGLTVAPTRLMGLAAPQLKALVKGEAAGVVKPALRKLLAENHLLTGADLVVGQDWLEGQGVAEAPLFQAMGLADRIALCDLAGADRAEPALGQEASAFAVGEARAPAEFGDYRRLYLALAARSGEGTAVARQTLARQCLDILLPWMFTALDCPAVAMPATADAVQAALAQWLNGRRPLGFPRATAGARQICERTDFTPQSADAGALIGSYLRQASAVISGGAPAFALGQDGRSMSATVATPEGVARLTLTPLGHLSLEDFEPAATPTETT